MLSERERQNTSCLFFLNLFKDVLNIEHICWPSCRTVQDCSFDTQSVQSVGSHKTFMSPVSRER